MYDPAHRPRVEGYQLLNWFYDTVPKNNTAFMTDGLRRLLGHPIPFMLPNHWTSCMWNRWGLVLSACLKFGRGSGSSDPHVVLVAPKSLSMWYSYHSSKMSTSLLLLMWWPFPTSYTRIPEYLQVDTLCYFFGAQAVQTMISFAADTKIRGVCKPSGGQIQAVVTRWGYTM